MHLLFFRSVPGRLGLPLALLLAPPALLAQEPSPSASSLSVDALIEQIVAQHPERQWYEAEIEAARAGQRGSSAWANPELSVDYGRKRVRGPGGNLADEGDTWAVAITQTFEWPGRLSLRKALADQDVELARLGLERFDRALAAEARRLAFGLHAAQSQAVAVREVADRFAALRETLVARDPAGIAAELDVRVIEAAELDLRHRATTAELAVQRTLLELNRLRGAPLDTPLRVTVSPPAWSDPPPFSDLFSTALANNFAFAARRAELVRQGLEVDLARNERMPAVSVSPFVGSESGIERETVVGLSLSLPLPVSRRAASNESAARARQRQADVALAVARRDLERDLLVAAQSFAARRADLPADPPAQAETFRSAAALADRHYRLGAVPVGTYVELQRSYLDALEALYTTESAVLDDALELEALTGLTFVSSTSTPTP